MCAGAKTAGWTGKLDLGNPEMLTQLAAASTAGAVPHEFPLRLVAQRVQFMYNSTLNDPVLTKGRGYNPLHVHPDDLIDLGINSGDEVTVTSPRSTIRAIVQADTSLRRGVVAMAHGFGGRPEQDGDFRDIGSPTGRLLDAGDIADPIVWMPRMSNIPVAIRRAVDGPT